jgi:polysaccharide biosynthesis transport protein
MHDSAQHEALSLVSVLDVLRRRIVVIALCVLIVPASALAFSLTQEKKYAASAQLLFRDPGFDQKFFGSAVFQPSFDPERDAATNLRLVSLGVVSDRTAKRLDNGITSGRVAADVSVSAEGQSSLISVTATDRDPNLAPQIANAFAREYIAFRRAADQAKIRQAQRLVQNDVDRLPAGQKNSARARTLRDQISQLDTLASLQTGNAELVQPAQGAAQTSPRPVRNTVLGLILGTLLGVGLAFLIDRLDRRLRDPKEVGDSFSKPILSAIPESRQLAFANGHNKDLNAVDAEAFRMLRANLRYFNVRNDIKSVLITSPSPGDGKSTVAWNLASASASAGAKVLLLEADMRHPTFRQAFNVKSRKGLSELLSGEAQLEEVLTEVEVDEHTNGATHIRTMDVITSGAIPPNPVDLLESPQMQNLLRSAEREYDLVVIDTPPTAVVSDAVPLIREVSGVVVVSRLGQSTRDSVSRLRDQLENLDAPTLGVVVNGVPTQNGRYGYAYGYGASVN